MAEYISREETIKRIKECYCTGCNSYNGVRCRACGTGDAIDMIEDTTAADVAQVVHGRWLNKKEWHLGRWVAWLECSCCGEHDDNAEMYEMLPFGACPANYCPNCGAKMDGGAENG